MSFEIKLPLFEGPFDLLLFFIERDELDIHDIPISKITNDFLDYTHQLEQINIDLAGEFLVVAATLMRIKSKMLIPRKELDEAGNEIDPREELVQHLLEYKKYKSVLEELSQMESERAAMYPRNNALSELKKLAAANSTELELQNLSLYKLMLVFDKVMKRYEYEQKKPVHTIVRYPYTMEEQRKYITDLAATGKKHAFLEVVGKNPSKILMVFCFLAILELLQLQEIDVIIGEGFNNFWIMKKEKNTNTVSEPIVGVVGE